VRVPYVAMEQDGALHRITVSLGERDLAERKVLREAYRSGAAIDWQGHRVRVTAEVKRGPHGESGTYVYELRLDRPAGSTSTFSQSP
jgi:hypothetical protein